MREGVAVLALYGEHDLASVDVLTGAVDDVVADRCPCVFDLRETAFIDSTILGVLMTGGRRFVEQGVGFATVLSNDTNNSVARTFDVTGLGPLLSATTDLGTAVATARG